MSPFERSVNESGYILNHHRGWDRGRQREPLDQYTGLIFVEGEREGRRIGKEESCPTAWFQERFGHADEVFKLKASGRGILYVTGLGLPL